jgi:hypothetical protein
MFNTVEVVRISKGVEVDLLAHFHDIFSHVDLNPLSKLAGWLPAPLYPVHRMPPWV